jgi:lysylphosphatidylglycerol synthetase-like protein (DUF2156 family)
LGVAILTVLNVISGLIILALGSLLVAANWQLGEGGTISGPSGAPAIILLGWAIIIVIIGFFYLAVASGLWNGSGWAWTICFVFSIIGIFIGLFFSFLQLQNGIIIMLIEIIALVYVMTGSVRAHFGKGPLSKEEEPSEENSRDKPGVH